MDSEYSAMSHDKPTTASSTSTSSSSIHNDTTTGSTDTDESASAETSIATTTHTLNHNGASTNPSIHHIHNNDTYDDSGSNSNVTSSENDATTTTATDRIATIRPSTLNKKVTVPPPPPLPLASSISAATTTSTTSATTASTDTTTTLTPSTTTASIITENDVVERPLAGGGSDSVPLKETTLKDDIDEKDLHDCLTPEALVRAASSTSSYATCKVTNQSHLNHHHPDDSDMAQQSSLLNQERLIPSTFPRLHNAMDKEDFGEGVDGCEEEEEDPDKLLASVPPELIRTTGNPASNSSSQPGAYHHYNSIGIAAPITGTSASTSTTLNHTRETEGTTRRNDNEEESENVLIEATLVTDETNHNGHSNHSEQLSRVEQSPPVLVVPQPPIYNAQIVDESDLVESQTRNQQSRLEPFSISNTILNTRGNGNVVISKTKLRCIIYIVILLVGISIISITVPLVLRRDDKDNDQENDNKKSREEWALLLVEQKQRLLLQNYDNYKFVTHHASIITIRRNKNNIPGTANRSSTVCSSLFDAHETNGYFPNSLEDAESRREKRDDTDRFLQHGDIFDKRQSHRHHYYHQQLLERMLSENDDEDAPEPSGEIFDDYIDYEGIVITLTCSNPASNKNDSDSDTATAASPIILLHNDELRSPPFTDIFDTDQWSSTGMKGNINVDIPSCFNELFPPSEHNDDELAPEEKEKKQDKQRPENIFKSIDPMVYGTFECRIFPKSPDIDLVEHFLFVYTCASSSSNDAAAPPAGNSIATNETSVSTMHIQNAVTECLSADNTNVTNDDSPLTITSISMSMQRLCRGNMSDGGDMIVPFQPQPVIRRNDTSNDTSISSSSSFSPSFFCFIEDGSIKNTIYYNMSTTTNDTKIFEYCTTKTKMKPFTTGSSTVVESERQLWCGPNDENNTDNVALNKYCSDLENSTTYSFYQYVIPNITIIDDIWLPNVSSEDADSANMGDASRCSFDTLVSSFVNLILPNETQNIEMDTLPTISIFGNAHYASYSNHTPTADSMIVATNLRNILLDLIAAQQQL